MTPRPAPAGPMLAVGLALCLGVAPAHGAPLSLHEARRRAAEQALEVERARAQEAVARAQVGEAWASSLPSLVAFGTGSLGAGRGSSGFDRPMDLLLGAGLSGSWTLVDPAAWSAAAAARQSAEGRAAMLDWAVVEARHQGSAAWIAAATAQAELAAWRQAERDAEEASRAVAARVEAGLLPAVDGARAEAELRQLRLRRVQAEGRQAQACATLLGLLREEPSARCLTEELPASPPPPEAGPATHPAVRAARASLGVSEAQLRAARFERLPSLSASGTVGAWKADDEPFAPGWSSGLAVELPLVRGGAVLAGERRAGHQEEAARAELALQERDLAVARLAAEARRASAEEALRAARASEEAAEQALELSAARHAAGLEPLVDLLATRRARDQARAARVQAQGEALLALAALERALGVP